MRKFAFFILLTFFIHFANAQKKVQQTKPKSRGLAEKKYPKIVVGIMIDQMRWDYLYRYQNRYSANGFNRIISEGFNCQNTFIPYTPTATACGHACVYTGSVPAIHGITGNNFWDETLKKSMYCVEDKTVKTVGTDTKDGEMSPRNMQTNTITDELRLATNMKSKTIAVSIKDRSSILPGGFTSNGSYWYDEGKGKFITSTFYMQQLPNWAVNFNNRNLADSFYAQGWKTLYPLNTYTQSTNDTADWERTDWMGVPKAVFPYDLTKYIGKDYYKLPYIPQGNDYTLMMAKAAIEGENLGNNTVTDFLAVSLSSPDYMGHSFGQNSVEAEDMYLRLDNSLANFFDYLDAKFGKGNYTTFITADHGAAQVPAYMQSVKIPAGNLNTKDIFKRVNEKIKTEFNVSNVILHQTYYNIVLNIPNIDSAKADVELVKKAVIKYLEQEKGIYRIIDKQKLESSNIFSPLKERLIASYYPSRSGHLQIIPQPQWFKDNSKGTDHSVWNPYDAHIPLLWYGFGIKKGQSSREVYMTDIAPTLAALLNIQMPNGCVGKVIEEVLK